MATQPILDTPRLRLRSPTPHDADGIAAYAGDPEVSRYVSWPRHRSIDDAHSFLRHAMAAMEQGTELHWVVTQRGSEHVLGTIALRLLEKIGMQREGQLRAWAIMPNLSQTPRDCWCYARMK